MFILSLVLLTQMNIGPIYQFSDSLISKKQSWYWPLKSHTSPCLITMHYMFKMITICMYILILREIKSHVSKYSQLMYLIKFHHC